MGERRRSVRDQRDVGAGAAHIERNQVRDTRARSQRAGTVEIWNELTRRLPEGTYLEKLAIENNNLQLIGLSREASQLVQLLQDAPQWRKVNLTGVLQADGAASGRDRFTMTAELQPLPAAAPTPEAADADAKRTP